MNKYLTIPELIIHDLNDYIYLVNGQAEDEIDEFLSTERTIDEFKKYVIKYHQIALDIPVNISPEIEIGIFEIRLIDTINILCKQAKKFKNALISRMTNTYSAIGKK